MRKINVLILGASGMVGHVAASRLKEFSNQFSVVTVARNSNYINADYILDVTDFTKLEKVIEHVEPDVVINAVGVLNLAADDLKLSVKLNSELPIFLSKLGKKNAFQFIHISTDCVFSGSRGDYKESDIPDAVDNYGITKIGGELIDPEHLVLRTSVIGPEIRPQAIGLFNWFLNQEGVVPGYENVIWSGVTSLALADALKHAMLHRTKGLLHLVNNQNISKGNLLELIHQCFPNNNRQVFLTPVPVSNKSLLNSRKDVPYKVPIYNLMLVQLRNWMETYPEKYFNFLYRYQR